MDGLTGIIFDLLVDLGIGENLATFILSFINVSIWMGSFVLI